MPDRTPKHQCLFCDSPADSLEHIIPQALGGRLARRVVCRRHNSELNVACDEPLIKQFQYFVHALRVVTERRNPGTAVLGTHSSGKTFLVDANHKPRLPRIEVLERDKKGVPTKVIAPDEQSARKFIASMGLDPDLIPLEVQKEPPKELCFSITLGGPEGFRGILKIAYEYVFGYIAAKLIDPALRERIRDTLLSGADAAEFVRWLPYEHADALPQAEFFSHRLIAASSHNETLILVELFNSAPFLVRLPGVKLDEAHMLFQGLTGELPIEQTAKGQLPFVWDDVPIHAQPQMFEGFEKRTSAILRTMQISDVLRTTVEAFAVAAGRDVSACDDTILEATLDELSRTLPIDLFENQKMALRGFASSFLPLLRSGAFNPSGNALHD